MRDTFDLYFRNETGNPTDDRLALIARTRAWLSEHNDHKDDGTPIVNSMDLDRWLVEKGEETCSMRVEEELLPENRYLKALEAFFEAFIHTERECHAYECYTEWGPLDAAAAKVAEAKKCLGQ